MFKKERTKNLNDEKATNIRGASGKDSYLITSKSSTM